MRDDLPSAAPPRTGNRRRTALILGGLALVVVGGVVAAYALFFTGDSPDRLALSDPSGAPAAPAPAARPQDPVGRWVVAPGSEAGYRVREKLVTIPVRARVSGDTLEVAGSLEFPMSMFDIDPPNVGGVVTVEPDATMEFRFVLKQA